MKKLTTMGKYYFLLLALFSQASPAAMAQSARKQIAERAMAAAQADIQQLAQLNNWPEWQSKSHLFIPQEASRLPPCRQPLVANRAGGEEITLSRLRYDIHCGGPAGWDMAVTVKPDVYLPVLVASRALIRGEQIKAGDLEVKKKNIVSLRNDFITHPDAILGLTVKRRIRPAQPVSLSMLDQPVLVERGQHVVMMAENGGVQARMIGEALKKGRKGDMIKVRNLSSKTVVSARVDQSGLVRIPVTTSP